MFQREISARPNSNKVPRTNVKDVIYHFESQTL